MKWIKYDIHTTTKDADAIGDILTELGIAGYEITDHVPLSQKEEKMMYTDIPADLGPDDGQSILTFYTEAPGNEKKDFYSTGSSLRDENLQDTPASCSPDILIRQIQEKIKAMQGYFTIQTPKITFCTQDDSLWKDKWKENFKPFYAADDILVKPTWEELPASVHDNDIVIEIDPGSAFGTGAHETTKLCLLSLRKYITENTRLLDAGCGSGILAIAALLCGANSAFCLDIDPSAVEGTLENAAKNKIDASRITAIQANILEESSAVKEKCNGTFDIAVANILADVIIPLSAHIGNFLNKNGLFISSGILIQKGEEVKQALLKNHFKILEQNTLGEWVSFVAQKR
ncbi:50S ribosomal protein L11 methyltransferase [bacterium D16-51]|nr:50S ribosomal protein L11 methyltransferase [bacterium D16-59]RKI62673.1 50S ribosomal protein L11 methyltransferase [bacterium D16-51]